MTPDIEQIRARHTNISSVDGFDSETCFGCDGVWPCDASRLLAALSEAEAERDELRAMRGKGQDAWVRLFKDYQAAEARLEALEGALLEALLVTHTVEEHGEPFDTCTRSRCAIPRTALAQEHTEPQEQPHGK